MSYTGLRTVISGGQTGADQAGLMAAFRLGVLTGGTAPSNWYTENGPNPLLELLGLKAEGDYRQRTIKNVKDSDGTVLFTSTPNSPGSVLTRNEATRQAKQFLQVNLNPALNAMELAEATITGSFREHVLRESADVQHWIVSNKISTLNVAGNREKYTDLRMTRIVDAIMTDALNALDMSDLLIRDTDF